MHEIKTMIAGGGLVDFSCKKQTKNLVYISYFLPKCIETPEFQQTSESFSVLMKLLQSQFLKKLFEIPH